MAANYIYPEYEVIRNNDKCIGCRLCERESADGERQDQREAKYLLDHIGYIFLPYWVSIHRRTAPEKSLVKRVKKSDNMVILLGFRHILIERKEEAGSGLQQAIDADCIFHHTK